MLQKSPKEFQFSIVFILLFIACIDSITSERVNCRRVVFHPYCRGISAKRSAILSDDDFGYNSSKLPRTLELRSPLPKLLRMIISKPDLREKILDLYHREQLSFKPMTATIIDEIDPTDLKQDQTGKDPEPTDQLVGKNSEDAKLSKILDQMRKEEQDVSNSRFNSKIKRNYMNDLDKNRLPDKKYRLFQARFVGYPEFHQTFGRIRR
ncbi:hypothetical protein SSS_03753 [Sarcoptes scabiei]|uniref:Uncharacterized protein n=1 Tax=Sarcoptes scabiei TaxID=52283 RepID=A0A834VF84_SARSC|nr:hypothetical protein SSS_03753 [Sarcoptes scabiei]UXI19200.1 hypothetical protein NH340_JMT05143 [Sarcoptes scabiei]